MYIVLVTCICLLFTSCGYHLGSGATLTPCKTISIPYVKNDIEGQFTDLLIQQISINGVARYVSSQGQYCLKVCLESENDTSVGYRYADNSTGLIHRVVASENRISIVAHVTLVDGRTGCTVLGPVDIPADLCYDFEPESDLQTSTQFSAGQLNAKPLATNAARIALYRRLAQKIAEFLERF